jgi:multidrug efflux pump subunit AcrB
MLTVQYPENQIKTLTDFMQIPLRSQNGAKTTPLESLADIKQINTPTEVDHYQLRRLIDIYVMPKTEDLSHANADVNRILSQTKIPAGVIVKEVGAIRDMQSSFSSFGIGLILAIVLVYLVLMAQFASFSDPFVILLAVPPGITGVLLFLWMTGTTVNVMSLMGAVMMTGIAVSNSILIVEFTGTLREKGMGVVQALVEASKARLRPILMTTLATVLGLIPMALALEPGSEQYAPLARAILGGLVVSVVVTVFLVPAAYLVIHRKEEGVRHHEEAIATAEEV